MIKLTISNFKGIKRGEIDLPQVSILIGPNNSGKTTILEALSLFPNPFRRAPYVIPTVHGEKIATSLEVLLWLHGGLRLHGSIALSLFHKYSEKMATLTIKLGKTENTINIHNGVKSILFCEPPTDKGEVYVYGCINKHTAEISRGLAEIERGLFPNVTKWIPKLPKEEYPKVLYFHPELRRYAWEYMATNWSEFIGLTSEVSKTLDKLLPEGVLTITLEPFLGRQLMLYLLNKSGGRIRVADLGDGFQIILTIALLYEREKPNILLIDDIESHMNPKALIFLTNWLLRKLSENDMILVVTTHSLEAATLLAQALEEKMPRLLLVSLREGYLKYKEFTLDEIEELGRAGIDPRQAEALII